VSVRAIAVAMAVAAAAPACADELQECNQLDTVGIVECLQLKTAAWDARLNAAYRKAMELAEDEQRERLREAQRLWLRYRDANCGYYGARQGSIRLIEAAECMRSMTESRTRELEEATRTN
jgi:uncharacterized protein YecT (DUF1311 family)